MQTLYLGRALRIKETLSDFLKWPRVTRHPLVFRGLTGSQRTPGIGASQKWTLGVRISYPRGLEVLSNWNLITPITRTLHNLGDQIGCGIKLI